MHDLDIILHETSMLSIHIDLCHHVHRYGGLSDLVTLLYVSDDNRGAPVINVWGGKIIF